jgi:hypothetical protein
MIRNLNALQSVKIGIIGKINKIGGAGCLRGCGSKSVPGLLERIISGQCLHATGGQGSTASEITVLK